MSVRVGAIEDTLALIGRVAGQQEVGISFPFRGTLSTLAVKSGQAVQAGDLLMELDVRQAVKDLASARSRADLSQIRLQQAIAAAASRRDLAVADAQDRVRKAQDQLDKVQAGATQSERRAAEAATVAAQAVLNKATADLERARTEPTPEKARATAVQLGEQKAVVARLSARKAQADLTRVKTGPDPALIRAAERALADAQATVLAAQAELDRLTKGPDAAELRKAERDLERARIAVDAAQSGPETTRTTSVATAKLSLDEAADRIAALRQPPRPEVVAAQQNKLAAAQFQATTAIEKLEASKAGPDALAVDTANATALAAQLELDAAEASLQRLKESPLPSDAVAVAQAALDAADLAYKAALERQSELLSRPTPAELRDAQSGLLAAQDALRRAGSESNGASELDSLKKNLEDDLAAVAAAQAVLEGARLVAPAAGTVAYVQTQPGDTVDPGTPSLILAAGGTAVLLAPLLGTNEARVAVGQPASVQVEAPSSTFGEGRILALLDSTTAPGSRVAQVGVNWGSSRPVFGASAKVSITLQRKDQVLLVPARAVRTAGSRRYVEYVENGDRRTATVQVGITTSTDAEILQGLAEGQQVLVPPAGTS